MTTTERPSPSHGARDLKLYLIAFLATAYVVTWWLFGARAGLRAAPVEIPAGWHIADRTAASPSAARRAVPVPVRVSPARPGRIRTRSS